METELWPNTIYYSKQEGAQVLVINARLSEKSFRGYQKFAALGRPMLQRIDCIAAQTRDDAERFQKLGVSEARLRITGSIKFELELPETLDAQARSLADLVDGERPVWIAASTRGHEGRSEEAMVLSAFRQCLLEFPQLLLILVPRHPERFNEVAQLCTDSGFNLVRRSSLQSVSTEIHVFLGDSMGEMLAWYKLSDIAYVGGSLVNTGCHNVLEPAALGLPVIAGPSRFNFQAICEQLEEAGALVTVCDETELAQAVLTCLRDSQLRKTMGDAGRRTIAENRGALERTLSLIEARLPAC